MLVNIFSFLVSSLAIVSTVLIIIALISNLVLVWFDNTKIIRNKAIERNKNTKE